MTQTFITLTTDFGPGNKGIGVMKATILGICPTASIIDLAHDIEGFNIKEGAKLFEAVAWCPVGFHVCVVDPGVGTKRRGVVIETGRGDYLIGPDNGVLIPVTGFLGGVRRAHQLSNEKFMRLPVSPIFHGRDVFAPAAAHLAQGVPLEEFGPKITDLTAAAYEEAIARDGVVHAEVVVINRFGSVFLNIRAEEMHKLCSQGNDVEVVLGKKKIALPYRRTFGDVPVGKPVIMDDDFGRVEIAINQGNFAATHGIAVGMSFELGKA